MTTVVKALAHARAGYAARLDELAHWLAIPSVSGQLKHEGDVDRAGRWLVDVLRRAGARTSVVTTGRGSPTVVAEALGPPGSAVVVVYGHFDVRPGGLGWSTPAFKPVVRGGALYGRGANDDKGQLFAVVAALQAWREAGGPANTVVVIAEGAEELGSPGLLPVLAQLARRVRPDVVVACDTERDSSGIPSVTISQRGVVVLDAVVDVRGPPVHAGRLGGAVADPSIVLAQLLLDLQGSLPRLALRVDQRPRRTKARYRRVTERSDRTVSLAAGGRATVGQALDRRITHGPALSVVRLRAGSAPGSVPSRAGASLDVRIPATWDVEDTIDHMQQIARTSAPRGVRTELSVRSSEPGFRAVPRAEVLDAVDRACSASFGRRAILVRSGGSLPAARLLTRAFGTPAVLLGLGTPAGGAHGPDEYLDIAGWELSIDLLVRLLACPLVHRRPSRRIKATRVIRADRALL